MYGVVYCSIWTILFFGIHGQNTTSPGHVQTSVMSVSMWLAQMSTMFRDYSVRYNIDPLPDRSPKSSAKITCPDAKVIYRSLDGSCNNDAKPTLGQSFRAFKRYIEPHYSDMQCLPRTRGRCKWSSNGKGCYIPYLRSARTISATIHKNNSVPSNNSLFLTYWAQFVAHDLSAIAVEQTESPTPCCKNLLSKNGFHHPESTEQCSGKCFPIQVEQIPPDRTFSGQCLEHVRSLAAESDSNNKREQVNMVTPFLDGSSIYGNDKITLDKLRDGGFLKIYQEELLPEGQPSDCILNNNSPYCFKAGDERVNQSPELTAIHTAMVNLHNMIYGELIEAEWLEEEKTFQETKKIVTALIQKFTYSEFLPEVLNTETIKTYNLNEGSYIYEPDTDPRIANVFSTAAFQFIPSMIPNSVVFDGVEIQRRKLYNNPEVTFRDPEAVAKYLLTIPAETRDRYVSRELTDHYFEVGNKSFDLVAEIIQRGRDHGLPSYRWFRKYCGLRSYRQFKYMPDGDLLKTVYDHPHDVDVFTGGMVEKSLPGSILGPTFSCLVAKQFRDIKFGDKFWWETSDSKRGFTPDQLKVIKDITPAQIFCEIFDVEHIQKNPFRIASDHNPSIDCSDVSEIDLSPWINGA